MKVITFLILFLFFVGNSFSYFVNNQYSNLVDKCCIVDLINYKENLKEVENIIKSKYPKFEKEVNFYISQVQVAIQKNPRFKKNKLKLYREIIKRTQDYMYVHNIIKPKPSYYLLAYFMLRIKDLYEYERNKKKYILEAKLENLDKAYGY